MNRFPRMCLQAFSTTSDPTGNPRLRQRSQRIRYALASQLGMQVAAGSRHSGGFAFMKIGNREQPFPRPIKSAVLKGPQSFALEHELAMLNSKGFLWISNSGRL